MKKDSILKQISFMSIDMIYKNKSMKGNRDFIVYCNKEIKQRINDEAKRDKIKVLEIKNLSDYTKSNVKNEIWYLVNGLRIKFEVDESYNILAIGFGDFTKKIN